MLSARYEPIEQLKHSSLRKDNSRMYPLRVKKSEMVCFSAGKVLDEQSRLGGMFINRPA